MTTPLAVTKLDEGAGVSRLLIVGDLDESAGEGLAALIANAADQDDVSEIVVDLGRVGLVAAAGVRALLRGRDAAAARGRVLWVENAGADTGEALRFGGAGMGGRSEGKREPSTPAG
ncbi:STAS domain-containing protein [Actinoplanes sp. NPDC023714]|uniref:STAS domain-containing protein n=1 Tax=Actinoplanes sp. NPDC023714 TaxID=3154322 RepID=UPI0033D60065